MTIRCSSSLSTLPDTQAAIRATAEQALQTLGGAPDLALAFVSHHHSSNFARLGEELCDVLKTESLLACTGESIVGAGQEVEETPAVSLWLARLPGVLVTTMHLQFARTSDGGSFTGWPEGMPDLSMAAGLLLLGEPFSFPADVLLARMNDDRPRLKILGGMASGGWQPGQNRLWLGRRELEAGAVAVALDGPVRIRSVVSQGCRPIGHPLIITRCERNMLIELGGKPALEQLRELWPGLSERDRKLVQSGLHVGLVINEYQDQFERGDFLVRNVVGADPERGIIAIGDYARVGQTMQFHVRDAQTADEDLSELLKTKSTAEQADAPAGALLFTCNGRGTRLFSEPHHDAGALAARWAHLPTAGFFAQGEIGPVGGKNFLHGFTASIALFEPVESA